MRGFSSFFIATVLSSAVAAFPASTTNGKDVQDGLGQDAGSPNHILARDNNALTWLYHVDNRPLDTIRRLGHLESGIKLYQHNYYAVEYIKQHEGTYVYKVQAHRIKSSFREIQGKESDEENWKAIKQIPLEYIEVATRWDREGGYPVDTIVHLNRGH
ncbi:hypothetical protein ACKVWC_000055 [Pyricularia oryzae]